MTSCAQLSSQASFTMAILFVITLISANISLAEDEWGDEWEDEWNNNSENEQSYGETLETWDISSFVEAGYGVRIQDPYPSKYAQTLSELRWRLEGSTYLNDLFASGLYLSLKADMYIDGLDNNSHTDLREALFKNSPLESLDASIGRQVITWGTGDLVFLNDPFPKDWVSFFSGRDQGYLKSPTDAVKLSFFSSEVNIDFVFMPFFNSDKYLTGERFSYFSSSEDSITATPNTIRADTPSNTTANGEFAVRLHKQIQSYEFALYGFHGRYKRPLGINPSSFQPFFPRLSIYGGSVLGPLGDGLINLETSYFDSIDDRKGNDPYSPNSQVRLLLGYQIELIANLSLGAQYYLEHTLEHSELLLHSFAPKYETRENREVITLRLNYRLLQDNLTLSTMLFYSPSDKDSFVMPSLSYRINDSATFTAGANIFNGVDNYTFFGQLKHNSNAYFRIRISY